MSVKFEYPYASPTVELNLRNPDLGDSMQHDIKLQYGRVMNGNLFTYKYTPATKRLLMTFRHLTKAKVDELIDFLHQTSGREIKYTDYNNVVWRGAITTDPNEITTLGPVQGSDGSSAACIEVSEITIEFDGEEV